MTKSPKLVSNMAKILVAEDDSVVSEAVMDLLIASHHVVEHSRDGQEALNKLLMHDYDLAILDSSLPALGGVKVCEAYRAKGGIAALLVLTPAAGVPDKVHGLDSGADDYLTKPFSPHEFAARVRALLRRPRTLTGEVLTAGDLTLDIKLCKVTKGQTELSLLP